MLIYYTKVGASGVSFGAPFTPISPLWSNDPETMFGDDQDDLEDPHYSPFNVQQSSTDDNPMTTRQFKILQQNMDSLIESSKYTSNSDYSIATHTALLEIMTKEHAVNLEKENKAIEDSSTIWQEMIEKVNKLVSNIQIFMGKFQTSFETKTANENQVISGLGTTLQS